MTISKDLLLSILAMDSYNQGYGRGLEHDETQIGSANVLEAPENIDQNSWENAGFYAVSYNLGNETIISYRGTDRIAQETIAL